MVNGVVSARTTTNAIDLKKDICIIWLDKK
jgi:hypothetical protein